MVALPGTPKAMVGTSAPPSLALLELSEAITPRTSPLPKVCVRALLGLERVAVGQPVDHRGADAGDRADAAADPRAAHDQPPVLEAVLHALPLAFVDVLLVDLLGDRGARDQQVAQLRQREQAEQQRRQRQAVPQIEAVHGPAQRAGLRIGADHRDHDAEAAGGDAAQRRVARQHGDHRYAEDGERQQFRRAEIEHHRAQDRDRHRQQRCAEDAAHHRRHVGGAERAARPRRASPSGSRRAPLPRRLHLRARRTGPREWDRRSRWWRRGRAAARRPSRGPCRR